MGNLLEDVRNDLIQGIKNDQIILPTLPEVALQVREVAQNPNSTVEELGEIIGSDVALSARIIKIANSPLMRGLTNIESMPNAISRLGMEYSSNLAIGLAMEQMFQATTDIVDRKMRDVWTHSSEVAAICHVLTAHYTKLKPAQATLAGLIHQIGVLPILTYAEEREELLQDSRTFDLLVEKLHPSIGGYILRTWDFRPEIAAVPAQYLNFSRNSPSVDYVDVTMVANLQSYVGTDHPYTKLNWSAISAFQKLGLNPDVDNQEMEDLTDEMEAAMAILSSTPDTSNPSSPS